MVWAHKINYSPIRLFSFALHMYVLLISTFACSHPRSASSSSDKETTKKKKKKDSRSHSSSDEEKRRKKKKVKSLKKKSKKNKKEHGKNHKKKLKRKHESSSSSSSSSSELSDSDWDDSALGADIYYSADEHPVRWTNMSVKMSNCFRSTAGCNEDELRNERRSLKMCKKVKNKSLSFYLEHFHYISVFWHGSVYTYFINAHAAEGNLAVTCQ